MAISDEDLAKARKISVEQVRLLRETRGATAETLEKALGTGAVTSHPAPELFGSASCSRSVSSSSIAQRRRLDSNQRAGQSARRLALAARQDAEDAHGAGRTSRGEIRLATGADCAARSRRACSERVAMARAGQHRRPYTGDRRASYRPATHLDRQRRRRHLAHAGWRPAMGTGRRLHGKPCRHVSRNEFENAADSVRGNG